MRAAISRPRRVARPDRGRLHLRNGRLTLPPPAQAPNANTAPARATRPCAGSTTTTPTRFLTPTPSRVRCSLAPRSRVLGFAALAVSNNGGVDWIELASAEYAIVNFIVPPRTDAAFAPHAAPPASPRTSAASTSPSRATSRRASPRVRLRRRTRGGRRRRRLLRALQMRNTDARRHARRDRTLRPKTNGRGRGNERRRANGRRLSVPSSRVAVAAISSRGRRRPETRGSGRAHAASAEGGGTAFVVHLTVRRDDDARRAARDSDADADADGDGDGSIDVASTFSGIGDSARRVGMSLRDDARLGVAGRGGRRRVRVRRARARARVCVFRRGRTTRRDDAKQVRRRRRGRRRRRAPRVRARGDPPSPPPRDARGSISPRDPSSPRRRPGRFVWRVARVARISIGRISPRSSTPALDGGARRRSPSGFVLVRDRRAPSRRFLRPRGWSRGSRRRARRGLARARSRARPTRNSTFARNRRRTARCTRPSPPPRTDSQTDPCSSSARTFRANLGRGAGARRRRVQNGNR